LTFNYTIRNFVYVSVLDFNVKWINKHGIILQLKGDLRNNDDYIYK